MPGNSGGGAGGGVGNENGTQGGGGGGAASSSTSGTGGDGFATFEYIGTASQYLIKYTPTVVDSEVSAATSASQARAAAQAAESYAGSAGIPVGTLFPYAADTNTPPTGFLFCDGSAVSRTMYADLFSVLGTTWGAGDGSTTFNLPRSEDLVMQGASATNPVGTYKQAGLPNIEGEFTGATNGTTVIYFNKELVIASGAFAVGTVASNRNSFQNTSGTTVCGAMTFDASRSNSIYGNSATVQPPAACVKFIIKAYDGVTPTSAGIDLSQYASALNGKASRSLDNLTDAGKDRFLGDDNFCIIYPNGGTEANPANVASNSRYVETNPFPGYVVSCQVEILYNNAWGNPGWFTSESSGLGNSSGVVAKQYDDGSIVVQSGNNNYVSAPSSMSGSPFGLSPNLGYPAKCRVKVWKIGKVASA